MKETEKTRKISKTFSLTTLLSNSKRNTLIAVLTLNVFKIFFRDKSFQASNISWFKIVEISIRSLHNENVRQKIGSFWGTFSSLLNTLTDHNLICWWINVDYLIR